MLQQMCFSVDDIKENIKRILKLLMSPSNVDFYFIKELFPICHYACVKKNKNKSILQWF